MFIRREVSDDPDLDARRVVNNPLLTGQPTAWQWQETEESKQKPSNGNAAARGVLP